MVIRYCAACGNQVRGQAACRECVPTTRNKETQQLPIVTAPMARKLPPAPRSGGGR